MFCTHYTHIQNKAILKTLEGFFGGTRAYKETAENQGAKKSEDQVSLGLCREAKACKEVLKKIV